MPFDAMGNYTGGYMMTPMEDEEERRRRLMAAQGGAGAKPTPIKETITIDPVTGERKIKIEGSERDLSALNPRTPTISMPGGTSQAPDLSQARPPAAPAMPAAPVNPDQFRYENLTPDQIGSLEQQMGQMGINDRGILRRPDAAEMFNQRPLDQRQQLFAASQGGVQRTAAPAAAPQPAAPVAPAAAQPPAAPVAPAAAQPPTAPPAQPLGTGITAPAAAAPAAEPDYMNLLQGSQINEKVRNRLITDPATPPDVRRAALSNERAALQEQRDRTAAQQQAQEIMAKGDGLAFAREMKKEGSLLKAMLLGAFGANDMARNELNKLGYGGTWQTVFDQQGNRAMVKVRQDGLPMEGFDQSGRALNAEEMGRFAIGGMQAGQLDIVGGTYVNDQTGEVGRMVTDKRTGRTFVQTDAGLKPMTGFRPQSSAGSLGDQRNRMIQELNLKLVGKSAEEAMAILRPYNQALAGQGLPIIQPSEVGIQAPQIGGGTSTPAAPAAQPAAPVAPGAMLQPTTPAAAQPTAPVAPGAAPPAAPAISATTPQLRPAVSTAAQPGAAPAAGGRPTLTQIQAQAAGQEKTAEVVAEDVGKARANNGKIVEQANTVQALTNQLIEHPGFSVSIGASAQPGFQFVPGTDKASFYAFFDQVKGQAFLSAIEAMKGLGALSDREGAAATAAVTAMSLDMNERDFRKAAYQLNVILKRAADRNAVKAGQQPPFNEPDLATQARQNREAERWLKTAKPGGKNADGTPITQEQINGVRERLRQRGELD